MNKTKTNRMKAELKTQPKNKRMQILVRESVKNDLQLIANLEHNSMNEIINNAIEQYVDKKLDLLRAVINVRNNYE